MIAAGMLSVRPDTGPALTAPSFALLDGAAVNLTAFKGKPTVLKLKATWGPPCVRVLAMRNQAQIDRGQAWSWPRIR